MELESKIHQSSNDVPPQPLRSVHTTNFPQILHQLGISLLVSTYQAGKLIVLEAENDTLNTHFQNFTKPMGIAVQSDRLAIGTSQEIWEFQNVSASTRKIGSTDNHDGCFLPRRTNVTGDIKIHEMAWVGRELWFVNTLFSCLAKRTDDTGFVPVWRPPFITELSATDRCHLNGLAVVEEKVRYVTAIARSNTDQGWRDHKRNGGILFDIESNEVITSGLSMPHSPRWYDGRLWVLDSGTGGIGTIDLNRGRYEPIAQLPGFTRGLDFCGPLAFIGLSQVRESGVFGGIRIAEQLKERSCGVWVIHIKTGETVAFVRFEQAVREIFSVQVLPGLRFPGLIKDDEKLLTNSFRSDPPETASRPVNRTP